MGKKSKKPVVVHPLEAEYYKTKDDGRAVALDGIDFLMDEVADALRVRAVLRKKDDYNAY